MRAVGHFEFLFNSCSLRFYLSRTREVDDASIFSSSKGFSTLTLDHQQQSKAIAGGHLSGSGQPPCKASTCHRQRFLQTWCRARGHTQGSDLSLDDDSGARVMRWISELPRRRIAGARRSRVGRLRTNYPTISYCLGKCCVSM